MHETLAELKLSIHPDKTFIGRISRGFSFLSIHFSPSGCRLADAAFQAYTGRLNRLYEQNVSNGRMGRYVRRWTGWIHFVFQTVLQQDSSSAMEQCRDYLQVAGTTLPFLVSYS